jgi:hypothetical protein
VNRQLGKQPRRIDARRDDDGAGRQVVDVGDLPELDVEERTERFEDCLRPIEVAVFITPGCAGDGAGVELGHEPRRLGRRDDARRHPETVLQCDVRLQPLERAFGVREKEVAASAEARIDSHLQALDGVLVKTQRLLCEQAVRRRPPLLSNATGLHT